MAMSTEELRAALAKKEAEAAEFQEQLLQAARFGEELMAQNKQLKEDLTQQRLAAQPTAARGTAGGGVRSRRRDPTGDSHIVPAVSNVFSTVSEMDQPVRKARSRTAMLDAMLQERQDIDEEHERLRRKCAELEAELEERTREVDARASDARQRRRSTFDRGTAAKAAAKVSRTAAEEEEDARAFQELEMKLRVSLTAKFEGQVEELTAKHRASEALVGQLRSELGEQAQLVSDAKKQYSQLLLEADSRRQDKAQTERALADCCQAAEQETINESARIMRKSIVTLSQRASLAFPVGASGGSEGPERTALEEFDNNDDDRSLEELEQENEELAEAIEELRTQLERHQEMELQKQNAEVEGHRGGGADAGGGGSATASAGARGGSGGEEVVDGLQAELKQVKREVEEARAKLKHRRASRLDEAQLLKSQAEQKEGMKDEEEGSFWDRWFGAWRLTLCLRDDGSQPQSAQLPVLEGAAVQRRHSSG